MLGSLRTRLMSIGGLSAVALATSVFGATTANSGELTIYAAVEADNLKMIGDAFNKVHPNIKINWIRDSTGIIQARLMAEKDNPRNDVLFGMTVTTAVTFEAMGMFLPYTPKGMEKLNPLYLSKSQPAPWTGIYGWASAICFNTVEAKKANLPAPKSWADLANPAYKGRIIMPNPASSGTGFLMVSAWIQLMGEEKAWAYMDKLHDNVAAYTHSGSKPCEMAAAGENVIGLSLPIRGLRLKSQGAPIDVTIAEEGTGWEMQVAGIMKNTKNLDDAKTFMDWIVTEDAMKVYARNNEVVALNVPDRPAHARDIETKMIKNDFAWAAKELPRIVAEWRKRYDTKTEPKKP
jgi:iron(III) transport system substrate-binding protein